MRIDRPTGNYWSLGRSFRRSLRWPLLGTLVFLIVIGISLPVFNSMTLTEYFAEGPNNRRAPSAQPVMETRPPHMREACLENRTAPAFRAQEIAWQEASSYALPQEVLGSREKIYQRFLTRAARFIHPNFLGVDCKDVPCVYAKVYKNQETAELAYLFFLATDAVLSAVPSLQPISPRSPPPLAEGQIAAYLFTPKEVERLTNQALFLTSRHNRLFSNKSLTGVMRFEHGMQFAGSNACGVATSGSHILLMDNCLSDHFWYLGFTHEVAHHFDFMGFLKHSATEDAKQVINKFAPANNYVSEQGSWMKLSGWKTVETVDPTTGGRIRQWQSDLGAEGFVRSYAWSNPVEDFADSTAHYFGRMGSFRKLPIQPKAEFITELVLSKGFSPPLKSEGEISSRRTQATVDKNLNRFLDLCLANADRAGGEVFQKKTENCVIDGLLKEIVDEIEFANFEGNGCDSEAANLQLAKSYLAPYLTKVSKSVSVLVEIDKLKIARVKMRELINPRRVFLQASLHANPSVAYAQLLAKRFGENLQVYAGIRSFETGFELDYLQREEDFETQRKKFRDKLLAVLPADSINRLGSEAWQTCTKPPFNLRIDSVHSQLSFQHPFLRPSVKPCLTGWIKRTSERIAHQLVPEIARSLLVTTGESDGDVVKLSAILSQELLIGEVNAIAAAAIEREETSLDEIDEIQRTQIRDAFSAANLTALPIFQQKSECLKLMQTAVFQINKSKFEASYLSGTNKIAKRHQSICTLNLEATDHYRKEIGAHERKLIRKLFSDLNQKQPETFSFTARLESFATIGLAQPECLGRVRELTKGKIKEFAEWPIDLISQAFSEICLIGRFAGRFLFTPSDRPVIQGGQKFLGTATYYDVAERSRLLADKIEIRYYLEAEKRFLSMMSELELQKRHREQ